MAGYSSARKLTNVVGRVDYISNPERQEKIMSFHNTTDNKFWHKLAQESQEQFKQSGTHGKCCEAREFIIALPQDCKWTAEFIAEWFKEAYGVECACAIHFKKKENNLHAHLIFSERELLPEPSIVEQKVAQRTYYYDEKGKKCKKADAVKVVPKGTVIKEGKTRYFTDKNEYFKTLRFALEVKDLVLHQSLKLEKFNKRRMWATKHIDKNNPKGEFIRECNELIGELNDYYKSIEGKFDFGSRTPKEEFCRLYNIPCKSTFSVVLTADIREKFANFMELYPINQKTAENGFKSHTEPNNDTAQEYTLDNLEKWTDEELDNELTYWKQQLNYQEKNYKVAETTAVQLELKGSVEEIKGKRTLEQLNETYKTKNKSINYMLGMIKGIINKIKENISLLIDEIKVRDNVANANLNYGYEKSEPEQDKEDDYEMEI